MNLRVTMNVWSRWIGVSLALFGCVEPVSDETATTEAALRRGPAPFILDLDMGFDDTAALAYMCQQHKAGRIDLLAVTVASNGIGLPGQAIRHARCVLQACGLPNIPVADGAFTGVNEVLMDLRIGVDGAIEDTLAGCTASTAPSSRPAPAQILESLRSRRRRVRILTLGPLTNVAEALNTASLRDRLRIRSIVTMGGAIDVPGNLADISGTEFDNSQEVNIWVDPPAAQTVLDRTWPFATRWVPLDATNDVPITPAFLNRLAGDRTTAEAEIVHTLLQQPFIQFGVSIGVLYWWDPLAAMTATDRGFAGMDILRIDIVQNGPSAGRTREISNGTWIAAQRTADRGRFETRFLDGLNGRIQTSSRPR